MKHYIHNVWVNHSKQNKQIPKNDEKHDEVIKQEIKKTEDGSRQVL